MITNISPGSNNYEETLNSLKYADRAKNIKVTVSIYLVYMVRLHFQAEKTVRQVRRHIHEYESIITELRTEISELKAQIRGLPSFKYEF